MGGTALMFGSALNMPEPLGAPLLRGTAPGGSEDQSNRTRAPGRDSARAIIGSLIFCEQQRQYPRQTNRPRVLCVHAHVHVHVLLPRIKIQSNPEMSARDWHLEARPMSVARERKMRLEL